jgi:flagellin
MTIENEKSLTNLRVKTLKHDGVSAQDQVSVNAIKTDGSNLASSTTFFVRNATTGVNTSFATGATHNQHEYSTLINNALGTVEGTAAIRVTTATAASFSTGIYYLKQESTGDVFKLSVSNGNTAAEWQTALSNAVRFGGDFDGEAKNLTTNNDITASLNGADVQFIGDRLFGDFNIYSDSTLNTDISDQLHTNHKVGVEGTGISVRSDDGSTGFVADSIAGQAQTNGSGVATLTANTTLTVAQQIVIKSGGDDSGKTVTVVGTNADGSTLTETLTGAAANASVTTINRFKSITSITFSAQSASWVMAGGEGTSTSYTYKGAREFGDFDIATSATSTVAAETASTTTGDIDSKDLALAATLGSDTATVQGTLSLKSSKLFSVTQSGVEAAANDNYFTTKAATLNTVSNIDLRTQSSASLAIATLDGAIQKISSIRSDLGAIENRLDHTVSNLMNIAEQTEAARSRIQDADFAAESAKLSKAQVLKQAGVGMLAQANAGAQLVLQLLQ